MATTRTSARVIGAQRVFAARRRAFRRRRARSWLAVALVLVSLAAGAWAALASPLLAVTAVTVRGTHRLTVAQVVAAAHVRAGESLLRLDTAAVAARVARLAPVAAVEVTRRWPHTVVVAVTERVPAAVADVGGTSVLVDRTGAPIAPASAAQARGLVPVHVGPAPGSRSAGPVAGAVMPAPDRASTRAAMQVLAALPAPLRARVASVAAPAPDAVTLHLRGGRTVVWGSAANSARKALVAAVLLRRAGRTVDVSAPGIAVLR